MTLTIPYATIAATFATATGFEVEVRGPEGVLLGWFTPTPVADQDVPKIVDNR